MKKFWISFFDNCILVWIIVMLVAAPIAIGAVAIWAKAILFISAMICLLLWVMRVMMQGEIVIARSHLWVILSLVLLIMFLQLVPFPKALVEGFSPNTVQVVSQMRNQEAEQNTFSVYPLSTFHEINRFVILLLVLFLITQTARHRKPILGLTIALILSGIFQVIYGFYEQFSTTPHIFWNVRLIPEAIATGTFQNKNNFCGLLEMVALLCLGLVIARYRANITILAAFSRHAMFQILAILSCIILFAGIFLSLSRGGLASFCVGLLFLSALLCFSSKMRRRTLLILGMLALMVVMAGYIGLEHTMQALERATSMHDPSRLELIKSGFSLIQDFPLMGTGWGTFKYVFRMYQPVGFHDLRVDYLHNDWLQLVCELGIPTACLLIWCIILCFGRTFLSLLKREDTFYKWLGLGALAGVLAMLCHSLVDFNLLKITANGMIFMALWGIAINCGRHTEGSNSSSSDKRNWIIPIPYAVLKIMLVCVVGVGLFYWAQPMAKAGLADLYTGLIQEGRGQAQEEIYFFLPVRTASLEELQSTFDQAIELEPENARYWLERSMLRMEKLDQFLTTATREKMQKQLGIKLPAEIPAQFRNVMFQVLSQVIEEKQTEITAMFQDALHASAQAIHLAPTMMYHQSYGLEVLSKYLELTFLYKGLPIPTEWQIKLQKAIQNSEKSAPNRPKLLFALGKAIAQFFGQDPAYEKVMADYFYRALYGNAEYGERVYLVLLALQKNDLIPTVTPKFYLHYENLYNFFWKRQDYDKCLQILAEMPKLPEVSLLWQDRPLPNLLERQWQIIQRTSTIYMIQGKWKALANSAPIYAEVLAKRSAQKLADTRNLEEDGILVEAFAEYQTILAEDWKNIEVALQIADLAALPELQEVLPPGYTPMDYLRELLLWHDSISPEVAQEIVRLATQAVLEVDDRVNFIQALAFIKSNKVQDGLEILQKITLQETELANTWRQYHLVWQFMAVAYQKLGMPKQAQEAWKKVLSIVPTHSMANRELAKLSKKTSGKPSDSSTKPSASTKPSETRKPGETVTSTKPSETRKPGETGTSTKPGATRKPGETGPLAKPGKLPKPVGIGKPIEAIDPRTPAASEADVSAKPKSKPKAVVHPNLVFGGKVRWQTYSITEDELTLSWEFLAPMSRGTVLLIEFLDPYHNVLQQLTPQLEHNQQIYPFDFSRHGEVVQQTLSLDDLPPEFILRISWISQEKYLITNVGTNSAWAGIQK